MTRGTMLYLFERGTRCDSTWEALRATDYEVVSTSSATQAMALLFLMQSVAGIVVDEGAWRADADLVERIRAFCPYLRVVLLVGKREGERPEGADVYVGTARSREELVADVQRALTAIPDEQRRQPAEESAA